MRKKSCYFIDIFFLYNFELYTHYSFYIKIQKKHLHAATKKKYIFMQHLLYISLCVMCVLFL